MNKSNAIVSGLLGVVILLVAYNIILNPPQKIPIIDDIDKTTKTVVGDQVSQKDLTLTDFQQKCLLVKEAKFFSSETKLKN